MAASDAPASPIRDRLLGRALQRVVLRGMRDHPELTSRAAGAPEVRLVGVDPLRALVVGSGFALGYGVTSQSESLTGALAAAMQRGGRRGVIVQNRAQPMRRVEQTVADLGLVGAATFHTVVWCPSLFDLFRSPDRGGYQRALTDGLRLLRDTAVPGAEIIVCTLPAPTNRGPAEEIARTLVPRFDGALRRAVAASPGVRVAETPSFTSLLDPAAFSADYYRRWAEAIVRPEQARAARSA